MSDLERFSLEHFLEKWARHNDCVTVDGTLQEDGDHYVIDGNRAKPGTLFRVRKVDVTDTENVGTVRCLGVEQQLYRVSVKRGVPVQSIAVIQSDQLARALGGGAFSNSITVTFVNKTGFSETFTIIDKETNQQVFAGQLAFNKDTGPLGIGASDAGYGQVRYGYVGQADGPVDSTLLTNNEVYDMV
jgi:hypothetical protein